MEEEKSTTSEEKSDAFSPTGWIFEQMAVFVLSSTHKPFPYRLRKTSLREATLVLMAFCIWLHFIDFGLVIVHFHSRSSTEGTQRVCEFARRSDAGHAP